MIKEVIGGLFGVLIAFCVWAFAALIVLSVYGMGVAVVIGVAYAILHYVFGVF